MIYTKNMSRIVLSATVLLYMPFVGLGCGPHSSPRYPPLLITSAFVNEAPNPPIKAGTIAVSIAGCRTARDGLYVDIFVMAQEPEAVARLLGDIAVPRAKRLFDVQGSSVGTVEIRPAVRDASEYIRIPSRSSIAHTIASAFSLGTSAPYIGPGAMAAQTYRLAPEVAIQTIPIGIDKRLTAGTYSIRLTESWDEWLLQDCSRREQFAFDEAQPSIKLVVEHCWYEFDK